MARTQQQQHSLEELALIPQKLMKSATMAAAASQRQHSRSPAKSRAPPPPNSKRRRSPSEKPSSSSTHSSQLRTRPAYGSSYSWDAAQGQAFIDRISSIRTPQPPSELSISSRTGTERESSSPYMALVQLFNQFQGMPIDAKKTLVTVNVMGSTGPLRILVTSDATVKNLIKVTLLKYAHEGRVPALGRKSRYFSLYDSQYSSQALKHEEKVVDTGSRNFVLCPADYHQVHGSCANSSSNSPKPSTWWSYVSTGIKSLV